MKKIWLPLALTPVCLIVAGCGENLLDNAPVPTQLYFATTAADLAACGTIQVSGNVTNFASSSKPSQEQGSFHVGLKDGGYVRTTWTDDEVMTGEGTAPASLVMKRPGTYAYSIRSLFRYDWKLNLLCTTPGKTTAFNQSGTFKELHRAVVVRLTASQGNVAASFTEFLKSSTPAQLNLP